MQRRFQQLDVFANGPLSGNPLAVVLDGDGLSTDDMQRFANWTNLSETTFLTAPTDTAADYRVRIFTTERELPFAGHPTLGSCQAWLNSGGSAQANGVVVQQCGVGLVTIRSGVDGLAFAAPDLIRSGPVEADTARRLRDAIGDHIVDMAWGDNGPGWVIVELPSASDVLALEPDWAGATDLKVGAVGAAPAGEPHDYEVRAFFPDGGVMGEDPVTGSLNASIAQWLMGRDPTLTSYVARQGTALGRNGRVTITRDDAGIWVGGAVATTITGTVDL